VIGSVVECFGFVTTIIVVAWVCDWRTFFDDGGVDTEESRRGRSAAKKRVMKRECGGEEGRRRNRVHFSVALKEIIFLDVLEALTRKCLSRKFGY
jgi:hypothetical protein